MYIGYTPAIVHGSEIAAHIYDNACVDDASTYVQMRICANVHICMCICVFVQWRILVYVYEPRVGMCMRICGYAYAVVTFRLLSRAL